ncbi:DUF3558 domain-containing protein [Corynebacterium cystitidis]|nr:DUF3558 domain-containing protein [Corynebacterium cystitidis]
MGASSSCSGEIHDSQRMRRCCSCVVFGVLTSSCSVADSGLAPGGGVSPVTTTVAEEGSPAGEPESLRDASGGVSDPEAGFPAGAVDAFHFDSGTLQLGLFDPLEVYPDVFDPCQEITAEEFAESGYTTDGITTPLANGSALSCTLLAEENIGNLDILLAGNLVDRDDLLEQATILSDDVSDVVPECSYSLLKT